MVLGFFWFCPVRGRRILGLPYRCVDDSRHLQNRYFCILPTSTVYCAGQTYRSKADEIRQIEQFLQEQDSLPELPFVRKGEHSDEI